MAQGKSPSESLTTTTNLVFPDDTNPLGILYGGRIVEWMDTASAICAQLHTGLVCVTVAIDGVQYKASAKLGDIIKVRAQVTRTFNSSLEILAESYNLRLRDGKSSLVTTALFTFVALDDAGNRARDLIPVNPVTEQEQRLFEEAGRRKQARTLDSEDRQRC